MDDEVYKIVGQNEVAAYLEYMAKQVRDGRVSSFKLKWSGAWKMEVEQSINLDNPTSFVFPIKVVK